MPCSRAVQTRFAGLSAAVVGMVSGLMYLQLSQGETTAGADAAVVLDGRASHDRAKSVDGTGSDGSSLGLAGVTSRDLLAGLFSRVFVRTIELIIIPSRLLGGN